jgi:nitroreductase
MEVFEVIKKRRSIRKYLDIPVEEDKIIKITEAAILSPSTSNGQTWRFIALKDRILQTKVVKEAFGLINQ